MKINKEEYYNTVSELERIVDRAKFDLKNYQEPFIEEACEIVGINRDQVMSIIVNSAGITLETYEAIFIPNEVNTNEEYKKYIRSEREKNDERVRLDKIAYYKRSLKDLGVE